MTTRRKSFGSDNHAGAHPEVLRAMAEANQGDVLSYGADEWTSGAAEELAATFGASDVFFVFTGSAANVLGVSLMLKPYEAVICAESSHLNIDECGAIERNLGNKLLPVATEDGKLTPQLVKSRLIDRGDEHRAQVKVVQIAQVTELGTCYSLDEIARLGELCRAEGLYLHLDGARLANAAAYLGCELRDLAANVDVFSFGGTKNGAVAAEAVVLMRDEFRPGAPYLRKQQMQLGSKMRFMAAQFSALLADKLWLRNAERANAMAMRLAAGIDSIPGVKLRYPVQSNAVFVSVDAEHVAALQEAGIFCVWDAAENIVRWMTAFDTNEEDVDTLVASVRACCTN
jgi:threonine aldolase